ncbi:unnamed protein product [Rotaria sordida]|uniref:F-box domain-containing protein n=1 Tax=Rotaria sordida TaxID=392033 RepID=A0A815C0Y0_9BILA|nr:unnamed protein product [Rotaria sordida]CAF3568296.1 unnamed protein product [Rotaria sordida]
MYSKIEDLSIELWLEIFTYLKIRHQFNTFFNLNKRLNQILLSYQSHITLKNNDEDTQYILKYVSPYLIHRENVTGLRLENTNKVDLSNNAKLLYFPRVATLFLHRLHITKDFLNLFQQNSTYLRYLNISSIVSGDKIMMHQLLEIILSLSNLQTLRLGLRMSMSPIQLRISSKSPIKNLKLIGLNENFFIDRLIILLQYLPYLQSLHIITNQINFISTKNTDNISCTNSISSFTLNIHEFIVSFVQFTNFILRIIPYVQELKIICRSPVQNFDYLNHREWIMFIQSLPNLKKIILDISRNNDIDEQIWNKKCQMLIKLMIKNHIILQIVK